MGSVRPYVPQPMGSIRPYVPKPNTCFSHSTSVFSLYLIFKDIQCDTDNMEKCDEKQRMRLFILLPIITVTYRYRNLYLPLFDEGNNEEGEKYIYLVMR